MSWQAYCTNLEQGKAKCKYAGIYGRNPVSVWAESTDKSGFPITVEDVSNMLRIITTQDQNIMGTGIKVDQQKFTVLRLEPEIMVCQGKGDSKDNCLVVALSGQAIIICYTTNPDTKAAIVRDVCESMRDYLKSAGY